MFRSSRKFTIIICGQFIFFMAVGIKREAPFIITEIAQTAKVGGRIAQTVIVLCARFELIVRRPIPTR